MPQTLADGLAAAGFDRRLGFWRTALSGLTPQVVAFVAALLLMRMLSANADRVVVAAKNHELGPWFWTLILGYGDLLVMAAPMLVVIIATAKLGPQRGPKRDLIHLAEQNARHLLEEALLEGDETEERAADPVYELQRSLGLQRVPRAGGRIGRAPVAGDGAQGDLGAPAGVQPDPRAVGPGGGGGRAGAPGVKFQRGPANVPGVCRAPARLPGGGSAGAVPSAVGADGSLSGW